MFRKWARAERSKTACCNRTLYGKREPKIHVWEDVKRANHYHPSVVTLTSIASVLPVARQLVSAVSHVTVSLEQAKLRRAWQLTCSLGLDTESPRSSLEQTTGISLNEIRSFHRTINRKVLLENGTVIQIKSIGTKMIHTREVIPELHCHQRHSMNSTQT